MFPRNLTIALLLLSTGLPATLRAAEASQPALTASDDARHLELAKQLVPEQAAALAAVYPDFRLVMLCGGSFSGGKDDQERVLGVYQPAAPGGPIHRVGLIKAASGWVVHAIDEEIQKDEAISHSFPMAWQYTLDATGFTGRSKCGVDAEFGEGSDLTHALGDQPFFDLAASGLKDHKAVCFATDDIYNNWDCLVFDPKDNRFKLWYQQAHAD